MTTSPIDRLIEHIRYLSETIGARGSTRAGERQAADYSAQTLHNLGYAPLMEFFKSARSIYHPHILAALMVIAGFIIYPDLLPYSAPTAAVLVLLAVVSDVLELGFKDNLLRRLVPKAQSQNVIATLEPQGEHRQDLILIGHLDASQATLMFSTPRWLKFFNNFPTLAFVLFTINGLLYLLGAFTSWQWLWVASIPGALCALILLAICIQAELSPYSPGANDNASAVAFVLALAEHYRKAPLQHTRLWFVCTGCEETQHYGAIDFFKQHQAQLVNPKALVFELLGCAGPAYLTREGILVPFHPHPQMLKLAEVVAAEAPHLQAYPAQINGGNSEMADCVRFGVPALALFGLTRDGVAPYWHQKSDTVDKMDADVLDRTWQFTQLMIEKLDKKDDE